jgi:hypothetical protein
MSTEPTSLPYLISQLLQANWPATAEGLLPAKSSITWAFTRFEAMQDVPSGYVISCYNPGGPVTGDALSREVWQFLEDVVVDILVPVSGATANVLQIREAIRQELYDILHLNQFSVPGFGGDVYPLREKEKVESPQLMRISVIVRCRSFHIIAT